MNNNISLLGKWLKGINTSSAESRNLGILTAKYFGLSNQKYRKLLSFIRNKIDIVERKMSAKKWAEISYQKVPSRASMIYRKSFYKNDEVRYSDFISKVEKGEVAIKASTLYPYDLVDKYLNKYSPNDRTLNAQWEALPNYVEGENTNAIVVADVSGSMSGLPLAVSISLAIYFAEKNSGPFKNYFMCFSGKSELQKVVGSNLFEKVNNLRRAHWQQNTNIQAVFNNLLNRAIGNNCKQNELPSRIFIVSDMEFDACATNKTNLDVIKTKYENAGYEMPKLVFWNVRSRQNNAPINKDERGIYLVSGCSPSIFRDVLNTNASSGVQLMMKVLDGERYKKITF